MDTHQQFSGVKDSGKREEFATGSRRDTRDGKGRFDLISTIALRRLARHLENGARKYGDRNWEKGQPLGRYLDSAMRHLVSLLECQHDEDHAAAVMWNAMAFIHTAEMIARGELPADLDDIGFVTSSRDMNVEQPPPSTTRIQESYNPTMGCWMG